MIPDGRVRAWVTLAFVDQLGDRELHALLTGFGSPEAILEATPASLSRSVSTLLAEAIHSGARDDEVDRTLAWGAESGNHLLTWDDPDYPKSLLEIGESPVLLFYKGRRDLLNATSLAIVGSRNASPAGIRTAEEFAQALSAAGLTIISGLALGIDAAAHRGGLAAGPQGGSSIAVVGTGIDRIYPPANRPLAHQIAEQGGILSEFALGTPPVKENFPRRNRLISGMSAGVLVVEAALGSGSLITARLAGEQGREVFAIPGSIHSPFSKGCHKLIKEGAKLVESAQDVLEELNLNQSVLTKTRPARAARRSGDATVLIKALGYDPANADELVARLSWPVERVMTHLLELELSGSIAQMPGGRYQRVR